MWMGKQLSAAERFRQEETAMAEVGVVTMSSPRTAVLSRGEERDLPLFGPTGIAWRPRGGEAVLVIKGGSDRGESCIAGAELAEASGGLEPGELFLFSAGGASVRLKNDGRVEIVGDLYINGSKYVGGLGG